MRTRKLWLPIIFIALAGCGEDTPDIPASPQLFTDRDEMAFNTEFNSGTFVGQTTFNSLSIENRGEQTLEITDITLSGPSEFKLTLPEGFVAGTPFPLKTYERAFVQVAFKPTDDIAYSGKVTITSNAQNTPTKEVTLTGKGVNP